MKLKNVIYCLLAFCMLALSSCGPENDDYVDKVVGEYNIRITPNITVKFGNNTLPIKTETVVTTAVVAEKDDAGNVTMQIDGVNGEVGEMFFEGYCDGLGLKLQDYHYDGIFYSPEYGIIYCDIKIKNPTMAPYIVDVKASEPYVAQKSWVISASYARHNNKKNVNFSCVDGHVDSQKWENVKKLVNNTSTYLQ